MSIKARKIIKYAALWPSDAVTMSARFFDVPPESDPPTMTGSSVIVQGASAVSAPAINEISSKSIIYRVPPQKPEQCSGFLHITRY
jgi:hypothetical protein